MSTAEHPSAPHPIRTFIVIALSVAMVTFAISTFDYMLVPMQEEMGFAIDTANAVLLIPEIGGLALVFVAGALGDQLGKRRMIVVGATIFTVGALLICVATSLPVVVIGRVLDGSGAIIATVMALALLGETYVEPRQRSLAFGANAALVPAMWIVAPLLGAWVVENIGWRVVGVGWIVVGIAAIAAALIILPRDHRAKARREMVTPLLGGVVLAGLAGAIMAASLASTTVVLLLVAVAVIAAIALVIAMRTVKEPGLDLRLVRSFRGAASLGSVVIANTADLLFFTTLILQFRFSIETVMLALVMIPVEILGTLGGLASAPLMSRVGVVRAGVIAMLLSGLTALIVIPFDVGTAAWVVVVCAAVFAFFDGATSGPITARVMDLAPPGSEGAAAAHRQAWKAVGTAVGGVLAGLLVFGTFQASLTENLEQRAVPPRVASSLAAEVRDGALAADVARSYDAPPRGVVELTRDSSPTVGAAQLDAFGVAGIITSIGYVAAAGLLALSAVRVRRRPQLRPEG